MKRFSIFCAVFLFSVATLNAKTIDLLKAGGKNDGKTLNTKAIAKAIDRLSAEGGGVLLIPSGTFLTGPIDLKSNITLDLESGAILKFTDDFDAYLPYVEMRYEGIVMHSFHPLISARNAENITIRGRGVLDGNGRKWWMAAWDIDLNKNKADLEKYRKLWDQANDTINLGDSDYKKNLSRRFFRPPFFQAWKCTNIRIEGVKFTNSPFWTINPEFCSNITVDGVTIDNPESPNTDGINPESCDNMHISNCHISVGDDCITIKSGRDEQGRRFGVPCQNITITNCTMLSGHGGVVIGSEMSGDVRKITISNCVFDGTDRGIRLKAARGRGGIVEDIRVSNIVMRNIQLEAITMNLFYTKVPDEPITDRTPIFRNIHISGMTGEDMKAAGTILGLSEMPVSDISLSDINLKTRTGLSITDAANIRLDGVVVSCEQGPAISMERTRDVQVRAVRTDNPLAEAPVVKLRNCTDVFIQNAFPLPGSAAYLQAEGEQTRTIWLSNNGLYRLANPISIGADVPAGAVHND